jgi:MFS family permease
MHQTVALNPAPPLRKLSLRWSRYALTAIFFVNGIGMGAWSSSVPGIAARLQLDPESYGIVLGPYAIGAILSMLITGWLTTKFGSRLMVLVGSSLVALSLLVPAQATTMVFLGFSVFVLGAMNSVMDIAMNAHATLVQRDWEAEIMSSFHSAYSFGALSGAAISGVLFEHGFTPEDALLAGMAFILVVAFATYSRIDDLRPYPELKRQRVSLWSNRKLMIVSGLALLAIFAEFGLVEWSYKYVRDVAHASAAAATMGNGGFAFGMAISRSLGDAVIRRIGPTLTTGLGMLLSCAGLLIAISFATPIVSMTGFIMAGLGLANVIPMLYTRAAAVSPAAPGRGVSVCGVISYFGAFFEPLTIGYVASHFNQAVGLCLPLAALAAIGLSSGTIGRIKPTPHHD